MKNQIVSAMLALMLTGPLATSQTGDWQVVENLPQRTLISVEDLHHVIHDNCRFQSVVDGQLFCEYGTHPFGGPSEVVFRQESIRAVRREQNGTLIGLGIGAGAGAAIGAGADSNPAIGRGGSAIVSAGIYGAFGALIGSAHGHFSHGKIVYQNPSDQTKTSESAPIEREPVSDRITAEGMSADQISPDPIAAARSPYLQPEDVAADTKARVTLAQFPGRRPGPPFSRGRGYPGPAYPQMWSGRPSGRHALVGAIIGGLLGAAVGFKGNASAGSAVACTALGAGLGAAIGLSVPSFPGPQMYRRGWRGDHEEASRSNSSFRPDMSVAEPQSTGTPNEVQ
jgi:hypothetical protein